MSTEDRVARLEGAFVSLTEMARYQDERMDDFDAKMNALVEAQARTEANLSALAAIVGDTDRRLDRLAETVERFINGQGGKPQ